MNSNIEELLEKVADTVEFGDVENVGVNTRGIFQNTPTHVVISWRDPSALKLLLEHGADVNARGEYGFTPLHHAIAMKNPEAIDLLVSNGADPTLKTEEGDDALSLARKTGDETIIERLLQGRRPAIH
jgi:uncharacterized protein